MSYTYDLKNKNIGIEKNNTALTKMTTVVSTLWH